MPDKMNGENHSLVRLFLKSGFMKELDLTKGSVLKTLLQFAVPFLIANLLQALYGGADLFVVGWFDDAASVAAVAIGMKNYTFFSYESNEALHLSEQERKVILDCFHNIESELQHAIDKHSKTLIVNNIELFLNYCVRFYDRQFITRSHVNKDILTRFENLLNDYFQSEKPQIIGLPSVQYCADSLHLSPNYFGDLIKKETGNSAQEYIQAKLIGVAKDRIFDTSLSVSEIAYSLGFKYPQHFSRLFKQKVGVTPNEYRMRN